MHACRYQPSLLNDALKLLRGSDSTPRSQETWEKNGLVGVLAYEGDSPIGIIPLEPRLFKINKDSYVQALWVSGAHVENEYRSQGVGAVLDQHIALFYPEAQAVFAFRQDEGSRAYQWYMKMGYKPVCVIHAFKKEVPSQTKNIAYHIYESRNDMDKQCEQLFEKFNEHLKDYGGYVKRTPSFWSHACAFHYYRDFYKYALLTIEEGGNILAYAFLGETAMRDNIKRFDVLECVSPVDGDALPKLMDAIFSCAKKRNLQEVRIQCSSTDALKEKIEAIGFTKRWETNIIGKELKTGALASSTPESWKYFHIDYI